MQTIITPGMSNIMVGDPFGGVQMLTPGDGVAAESTLLTDLVSWWSLDEESGTRVDAHGSNDLTSNGTNAFAAGKIGNAVSTGSSHYLEVASNSDLETGDIDFSFAAWVYPTGYPGAAYYVNPFAKNLETFGDSEEYELSLIEDSGSYYWRFRVHLANVEYPVRATTFGNVSLNTWYHVVAWHDSTNNELGISVNGIANTTAHSVGVKIAGNPFSVGRQIDSGSQAHIFTGRVDELAMWKKVLTTEEINELYNSGDGIGYPG